MFVVLALALGSLAGGAGLLRYFTENQSLTRAAPTLSTDGMSVKDIKGFRVKVCAPSGQTLAGAGAVNLYEFDPTSQLWGLNVGLNMPITVTATSCSGSACRCQTFPGFEVDAPIGRILPAANAITLSGGSAVDIYVTAWGP